MSYKIGDKVYFRKNWDGFEKGEIVSVRGCFNAKYLVKYTYSYKEEIMTKQNTYIKSGKTITCENFKEVTSGDLYKI